MNRNSTLKHKIEMKRLNAQKEGIQYLLSDEEICFLLAEADITSDNWTFMGYHLSRYNDSGNYIFGNCRFVPYQQNYAEKKISEASRGASRAHAKRLREERMQWPQEERSRIAQLGGLAFAEKYSLTDEYYLERFKIVQHLDLNKFGILSQAGELLGVSSHQAGRMRKHWREMGLM